MSQGATCDPPADWAGEDGRAKLAYVSVADEPRPVHVSRYAHLAPPDRPLTLCPACRGRVILHLGPTRVHHAAHQADAACELVSAPETALHFNVKLYLAEQLIRAAAKGEANLQVFAGCSGYPKPPLHLPLESVGNAPSDSWHVVPCRAREARTWLSGWDEVYVDMSMGERRPDITLSRGGVPVGVVEVFASHAVSAEKAGALAALDLPWLEVAATGVPMAGRGAWTPVTPLEARQVVPSLAWQCATCRDGEARARAQLEAAREARHQAMLQGYLAAGQALRRLSPPGARTVERPWLGRLLDVYGSDGRRTRQHLQAVAVLRSGQLRGVQLWQLGDDDPFARLPCDDPAEAQREIARAYERFVAMYVARRALADSPMGWVRLREWPSLFSVWSYDTGLFPARYLWSGERHRWELNAGCAEVRWDEAGCQAFLRRARS